MGFLTLEGLERLWNHIVALVGNKVDSLNLKGGTGAYSLQQINANDASGFSSIALGDHTTAKGNYSTTIGYSNIANGEASMAAGYGSKAIGDNSFAEGYHANANGNYSQAKGHYVNANGSYSTVIGKYNDTPDKSGYYESIGTLYQTFENNSTYTKVIGTPILDTESGHWIFEGTEEVLGSTLAIGDYVCNSNSQWRELTSLKSSTDTSRTFNDKRHNIDSYNTRQSTYAFAVGNGTSDAARSNAHILDWNGNAWFAGDVSVGENKTKLIKDGEQDFVVTFAMDEDGNFTSNKTFEETLEAYDKGYNIAAKAEEGAGAIGIFSSCNIYVNEDGEKVFLFLFDISKLFGSTSNMGIIFTSEGIVQQEFPATNETLTFTGAVSATYDGSEPITIEIPENSFKNLVDGIAEGSVRGVTAAEEDNTYALGKNAFAFGPESKAEGENSVAIQGWAKSGIAIGVKGNGWTNRILTGEANATTYTYNWDLGDNTITPGCYLSLDKEKLIKVISTNGEYLTVEETLSSTPLNNATVYAWRGVTNDGIGIGGEAYDGGISIGGAACGGGAVGVAGGAATNWFSFAQGAYSEAKGAHSSAMGFDVKVTGHAAHAEGNSTKADGQAAHAEGSNTVATGISSHAEGSCTLATGDYQHVQGKYNIEDTNNTYAHIVGNGTKADARSNAHTLDWSGNAWFAGNVKVGGSSYTAGSVLATESYVDTKVADLVKSAPEALDTLNELAAALGDDPNFATTVATEIGKKADKTDLVALTEAEILEVCGVAAVAHISEVTW